MASFLLSMVLLVVGYLTYGALVERIFGIDTKRITPAVALEDGVDYVPMGWGKIFLIQFLNIAGLGPIFGAIMGAMFGPAAFLWIVFGTIFAGGVHDYLSGMMSLRHDGKSIPEVVGMYLGNTMRQVMRVFSIILLILVGTVFMAGPAGLLANLGFTGIFANKFFWVIVILAYYFIATVLPVDKIIARFYPVFGIVLLIMAVGVGFMLVATKAPIPNIAFVNMHPKGTPIWPILFITIACGAISGFHSTQSPLMSRCLSNESYGRKVFYGAMVGEGMVALVWAAAAMAFFPNGIAGLNEVLSHGGAGLVVNKVSMGLLGPIGGVLAMLGVIACPITSGDTAFRSTRLILGDMFSIEQKGIRNRLLLAVPILGIGFALNFIDFTIIWRYFAWSNQTLATIVLWTGAVYLHQQKRSHLMASIPAAFMTAVVTTYILMAPEGFSLPTTISYPIGILAAVVATLGFVVYLRKQAVVLAAALR